MKKLVTSYTFNAAAKTIASADFTSLEKIQLITNVTDQIIIYNFADTAKGGTLAGTTLTLEYDTTAMDNADKLQIFVEDATVALPVTDNGGSITVDGTFWQATQPVSLASVPSHAVTNAGTFAVQSTNQANSGVDIGDVTINNTTGAGAVNIQDGGNSITVDGTVSVNALPAGTANIGDVDVASLPVAFNTGTRSATTQRVTIATDDVVPVTDNGGSLTVDGTVTANLAAGTNNIGDVDVLTLPALPAGNNNIGDVDVASLPVAFNTGTRSATTQRVTIATDDLVPVSLASVPSHAVTNAGTFAVQAASAGDVAHDAVDTGNPQKIGGKASSTTPTPVASNDRVDAWFDPFGRQAVSDMDPELGTSSGMSALRDKLVAQRYTVLADSIADGLATFWTTTNANGGTTTSTGGEGLVQTSASATGSSQIVSSAPPYLPGQTAWFNSAIRLGDTGSAGNIRRWGVFTVSGTTPQEGFYYELSGTTFNAVVVKAGTPTATAVASWSRASAAPFTLDTNYHSFEIRWTANSAYFYIDNVLRHVVSGTTTAITSTLNFPMTIHSVNTSGASNRLIAVRNCGIGRFGTPDTISAGGTPYKLISAATTNATSVKATAGTIFHISASNINAAVRYLKLYNKASAPTVGTDVPVMVFAIPGNTAGAGTNVPIGVPGVAFTNGIAFALTTGAADTDSTAVAANEIIVNLGYL